MKNISILLFATLLIASCKDGEEQLEQNNSVDESNLQPLMNMYGNDSIDAQGDIVYVEIRDIDAKEDEKPEEDLGYSLGVRPANALANQYGEDSIDAQGNYVYPPRDTIWNEDRAYTLGAIPDRAYANMFGQDSIDAEGNLVYPPRDTIWDAE